MIKAGIIGATGYAGNEIVRLLLGHKDVEIKWFGSRSYIDQQYADILSTAPSDLISSDWILFPVR